MEDDLFGWSPAVRTPHYANERPVLPQEPTKVEWDDEDVIQTKVKNLVFDDLRKNVSFYLPETDSIVSGYLRYINFLDNQDITIGIAESLGEEEYFAYYKVKKDMEIQVYR